MRQTSAERQGLIAALLGGALLAAHPGAAEVIDRASLASDGTEANASSTDHALSGDGRVVAFVSTATSLVPGCADSPSGTGFLFLRDLAARATGCVPAGGGDPPSPALSADGRVVVFRKQEGGGAVPPVIQTFVHDRVTGETRMASVTSDGTPAKPGAAHRDTTTPPAVSADGRIVAFGTDADNLVAGLSGLHVYVHDRSTATTTWVSRLPDGTPLPASSQSGAPALNADGRVVVWAASDGAIYAHDRASGLSELVSRPPRPGTVAHPWVDAAGGLVAFVSSDDGLVPGDANGAPDLFLYERATRRLTRIGVPGTGPGGDSLCGDAVGAAACRVALSADTRHVAFSRAGKIFAYDRITGLLRQVSVAVGGGDPDGSSRLPRVSADGAVVGFLSAATNLVPGDTNGLVDVFVARAVALVDFVDVPAGHWARRQIEVLHAARVTAGCSIDPPAFCPDAPVTREQMAVFLLRAKEGPGWEPAPCETVPFVDVPCASPFAAWIQELVRRGVTGGCGGGYYCPASPVTREQMAVFLLKVAAGPAFGPAPCSTSPFVDVPCSSPFASWIAELVARAVTAGCAAGRYCPDHSVSRAEMAVFLSRMFGLTA